MVNTRLLEKPSAWRGHMLFGSKLCELLKPQKVVDLGVHYGHSTFAMAEGCLNGGRPSKVYAVDTWRGDAHAGAYDEKVYEFFKGHKDEYDSKDIIQVRRGTFDDAAEEFKASVDILHIDGLHTFEAVFHDFTTWLPKMRPYGVMMFHDTQVKDRGFGVHKFWRELQATYPEWKFHEFKGSFGLGVAFMSEGRYEKVAAAGLLLDDHR